MNAEGLLAVSVVVLIVVPAIAILSSSGFGRRSSRASGRARRRIMVVPEAGETADSIARFKAAVRRVYQVEPPGGSWGLTNRDRRPILPS